MVPVVLVLGLALAVAGQAAEPSDAVPEGWPDDKLTLVEGTRTTWTDLRGAQGTALVWLGVTCPVANRSAPTLRALATDFADRGVALVGVYSEPGTPPEELRKHGQAYGLTFPRIADREQKLARALGVTYTPEVLVFAPDGELVYRGRIDNRFTGFGQSRREATRHDLRDVMTALAVGDKPPYREEPGFGCTLFREVTTPDEKP